MKNSQNKINKFNTLPVVALTGALFFGTMFSHVYAAPITEENVANLINQKRSEYDLPKLKINSELNTAASNKSKDMLNRHYFEHFAFGLSPWDFIVMSGYNYLYAGENLAMDFNTSEGMVSAWLNSPTHRENILNPDYTEMGLGIVKGDYTENTTSHQTIMVDNMFGRQKPTVLKIFDAAIQTLANIF